MFYVEYYDIEKKLWVYCPESKGSQTHAKTFALHYSKLTGRFVRVRECAGWR